MAGRCGVVEHGCQLRIAHALDTDFARALLHSVSRIGHRKGARWFGNGAEIALDQRQGFRHIQLAGDHQHGIVRLVVLAVKSL